MEGEDEGRTIEKNGGDGDHNNGPPATPDDPEAVNLVRSSGPPEKHAESLTHEDHVDEGRGEGVCRRANETEHAGAIGQIQESSERLRTQSD
jgi:hypothetical protein